jgi:hypothetical protein
MPPACCACSSLACATRVPHAASLPMRRPLSLAPRHLYHPCTAAQFARTKVRNSPPLQPLLVFFFSCSLLNRVAAACTIVRRVTAAAARITHPDAADTAHAISHDGVVLVRGGCGCWHACI